MQKDFDILTYCCLSEGFCQDLFGFVLLRFWVSSNTTTVWHFLLFGAKDWWVLFGLAAHFLMSPLWFAAATPSLSHSSCVLLMFLLLILDFLNREVTSCTVHPGVSFLCCCFSLPIKSALYSVLSRTLHFGGSFLWLSLWCLFVCRFLPFYLLFCITHTTDSPNSLWRISVFKL